MNNLIYKYIYKSNGFYFGFIYNNFLYSRDGLYLGWIDGDFVWDSLGQFRGQLFNINNFNYILQNNLIMSPTTRTPKPVQSSVSAPPPPINISPVSLPVGIKDAY